MKEFIGLRLEEEIVREIDLLAQLEKRPRSMMIRLLIDEALEDRRLLKESVTIREVVQ